MILLLKLFVTLALIAIAYGWIYRGFRAKRKYRQLAVKAAASFEQNRELLERSFHEQLKKPNKTPIAGLSSLEITEARPLLASDLYAGELYALAAIRLVDDQANVIDATAIYRWSEGKQGYWVPTDRLLKELTPDQAVCKHRKWLTEL